MNGDVNYVIAVTQVGCVQSSITQPTCFELGFDKEAFLAPTQLGWTNLVGLSVNHNFRISPFEFHAPPSSGGQHLGYLDNSSGKSTTKAYLH